jgi:hypothetical protein
MQESPSQGKNLSGEVGDPQHRHCRDVQQGHAKDHDPCHRFLFGIVAPHTPKRRYIQRLLTRLTALRITRIGGAPPSPTATATTCRGGPRTRPLPRGCDRLGRAARAEQSGDTAPWVLCGGGLGGDPTQRRCGHGSVVPHSPQRNRGASPPTSERSGGPRSAVGGAVASTAVPGEPNDSALGGRSSRAVKLIHFGRGPPVGPRPTMSGHRPSTVDADIRLPQTAERCRPARRGEHHHDRNLPDPSGPVSSPSYATTGSNDVSGWAGWVVFAGIMLIMLGAFQAIEGLVVVFDEGY